MRYAPDESNTKNKKMYFFKKGLSMHLKVALLGHTCYTLWERVNKALEMERDRLEANAQRKEKKCQFLSWLSTLEAMCSRAPSVMLKLC